MFDMVLGILQCVCQCGFESVCVCKTDISVACYVLLTLYCDEPGVRAS